MKRFIEGVDRSPATLFPERLNDYVSDDNSVRAIDAFVDALDLNAVGFDVVPEPTGRPGFHPATMLKIYVYGCLNQVQSSRRLERECSRNVKLIWLTLSRLMVYCCKEGLRTPKTTLPFKMLGVFTKGNAKWRRGRDLIDREKPFDHKYFMVEFLS